MTALTPLARFLEGAIHDRWQPLQAIFEYVVRRAAFQRFNSAFFTERAGNEDERYAWRGLLRDRQRFTPVKPGQGVISEHEVDAALRERFSEIFFRGNERPDDTESILRQLQLNELSVVGVIFEKNELERADRFFSHADLP